jgi:uroporphyrinogen decarboxylase
VAGAESVRLVGDAATPDLAVSPATHRERIAAAIRGERVRPLPVAFWHHFPQADSNPVTFAEATVAFYRQFDVDLVKLMPTGMYPVMDYGVAVRPSDDDLGTTVYFSGPIAHPDAWDALPAVSPERGVLGDQVAMAGHVRAALGPDVPIIQTIFSPLTMAAKLAGGTLRGALLEDEDALRRVLARLAADVVAFGDACLDIGVDGFFFATQLANAPSLPRDVYARLGEPYDLEILEALRPRAWLQVLHLHGQEPFFELADRYPVDVVNWEDRETRPTLRGALQQTSRCLLGGVVRGAALATASEAEITAQVADAAAQTEGQRVIVGAGCVVSVTTPDENLQAIVRATRAAA